MEIIAYTIIWLTCGVLFGMFLLSNDPYIKANKIANAALEHVEILKHKWLESEKAGHDIGMKKAKATWKSSHAKDWRKSRKKAA
jgi:hypothetical protein